MPLLPSVPAAQYRMSPITHGDGYSQLCKIFALVLLAATVIRLSIIRNTTRRRSIPTSTTGSQEKDTKACEKPVEKSSREHAVPQGKERPQVQPAFTPLYPWLAPPQPLPGPYDPRLYPLPTVRRHSFDPSIRAPAQDTTTSYSRRISTNDLPLQQAVLHGSVTTSTKGWRRNHWVVSGA
jgi:hypothetical protein